MSATIYFLLHYIDRHIIYLLIVRAFLMLQEVFDIISHIIRPTWQQRIFLLLI